MIDWPITVDASKARQYLGKPHYRFEPRCAGAGVATGLAWTPTGGEVLFVEAAAMPGSDEQFILTGQLGDVMRESARIALSYVESHLEAGSVEGERVGQGPPPCSGRRCAQRWAFGGVTMVTALVSLLTQRPVDPTTGMTGEVTLQGRVPIGGLKLKALAALVRASSGSLCPNSEVDLDEIPEAVRNDMEFILVDDISRSCTMRSAMLLLPTRRRCIHADRIGSNMTDLGVGQPCDVDALAIQHLIGARDLVLGGYTFSRSSSLSNRRIHTRSFADASDHDHSC